MPTESRGRIYALHTTNGSTDAVILVGRKTIRIPTDEPWVVGDEVIVKVERAPRATILDLVPEAQ